MATAQQDQERERTTQDPETRRNRGDVYTRRAEQERYRKGEHVASHLAWSFVVVQGLKMLAHLNKAKIWRNWIRKVSTEDDKWGSVQAIQKDWDEWRVTMVKDLHLFISVSPYVSAVSGGVLACDDDVCEAAEIEDVEVDGRAFLWFQLSPMSIEDVAETAPGMAEYAKSACPGLKLYGSTEADGS